MSIDVIVGEKGEGHQHQLRAGKPSRTKATQRQSMTKGVETTNKPRHGGILLETTPAEINTVETSSGRAAAARCRIMTRVVTHGF